MTLVPPVRPDWTAPVTWLQPPRQAQLSKDEVQLWKAAVDLDESSVGDLVSLLSLTLKAGRSRFTLSTLRAADFPIFGGSAGTTRP